jgi:hypothetical protein
MILILIMIFPVDYAMGQGASMSRIKIRSKRSCCADDAHLSADYFLA